MNPTTKAKLVLSGQCTLVMVSLGTCVKSDGTQGLRQPPRLQPDQGSDASRRSATAIATPKACRCPAARDAIRYFMSARPRRRNRRVQARSDTSSTGSTRSASRSTPWQERPNSRLLNSFRANISAQVNPQFDADVNFGYSTIDALTSNESNNTVGIGSQAFGGPGYRNNGLVSGLSDSLVGYRAGTPGLIWAGKAAAERQPHDRCARTSTGVRRAGCRRAPTSAPTSRDRVDTRLHMNGEGWPLTATYRDGSGGNGRTNITNLSADLGATANYNPSRFTWLSLKTTRRHAVQQLPPGPEQRRRHDAAARARSRRAPARRLAPARASRFRRRGASSSRKRPRFATACSSRPRSAPTRTAPSARTSSACTIRRRACRGSISDEDFFPHGNVFSHDQQPPPASRQRRVRRAAGSERRPADLQRQFGQHQERRTRRSRRSTRSATTACKPERSTEWETGFDSQAVRQPDAVRRHVLLASSRTTR